VKEVLIKEVAQALRTYIMSMFKIPFGLCDSTEAHSFLLVGISKRQTKDAVDSMGSYDKTEELWWTRFQGSTLVQPSVVIPSSNASDYEPGELMFPGSKGKVLPPRQSVRHDPSR
jgi:hypothetical protein